MQLAPWLDAARGSSTPESGGFDEVLRASQLQRFRCDGRGCCCAVVATVARTCRHPERRCQCGHQPSSTIRHSMRAAFVWRSAAATVRR